MFSILLLRFRNYLVTFARLICIVMVKRNKIYSYLSLVKFSHTVFAMPFALIGFFYAYQEPSNQFSLKLLALVLLCMVFARNTAMSFNRLVDRKIDAKNPRTNMREIPQGIIKPKSALTFVIINSLAFIVTTYLINSLVFALSPVALLVVLFYSYTKRFTSLCHFVLGLGLSLAPIGAYLAVTGEFALMPILFSVIVLFWSSGFDIIYSLQDEVFDKGERLHSIPAALGRRNALILAIILHFFVVCLVAFIGLYFSLGFWYWIGAALFVGLLVYQHLIVSPSDISRVNIAFATTNGAASILFAIFNIIGIFFKG